MHNLPQLFFGTTREHYLLLFGVASTVAMFTGAISAWIGAYFGGRQAARRIREAQAVELDRSAAEIAALREAVETIGIEVERIAEGQRFTTKILAERTETRALPEVTRRPQGAITPH